MKQTTIGKIRKLITGNPTFVFEKSDIKEVINRFIKNPIIRAVYVVDEKQKLKGIITITDILKKISIDFYSTSFINSSSNFLGYDLVASVSKTFAKDFMNAEIYYIKDNDNIEKAFQILFRNKVGEIPVVNDDLILIGDLNVIELLILWEKYYNKSSN